MKSRPLFTDKWNSFWHFVFGLLAVRFLWMVPLFIAYQLYDYNDVNLFVDLAEFFIGFLVMGAIFHYSYPHSSLYIKIKKYLLGVE